MEQRIRCIVCGGATRVREHGGSTFWECASCGYAQLTDRTARDDYWGDSHGSTEDEAYWIDAKRRYFDNSLRLLGTLTPGRRLLDVGGGVGFFAHRATEQAWDAYSLDISEKVTQLAAQRLGADRAWLKMPADAEAAFDVVTMWCVVAHTREPAELLRTTVRALRPGGVIWITTPNFRFQRPYSAARKLIGRPLDFAEHDHVGHFTVRSLTRLLNDLGFAEVRFHYEGITEACVVADSSNYALVRAKRAWNAAAAGLLTLGLANVTSELQVTARKAGA